MKDRFVRALKRYRFGGVLAVTRDSGMIHECHGQRVKEALLERSPVTAPGNDSPQQRRPLATTTLGNDDPWHRSALTTLGNNDPWQQRPLATTTLGNDDPRQ
jgi:hypothetical protein